MMKQLTVSYYNEYLNKNNRVAQYLHRESVGTMQSSMLKTTINVIHHSMQL